MKLLIPILLVCLLGCKKEEDKGPQMGCQTGVIKNTTTRVTIRCCTRDQYLAGDNVNAGGYANLCAIYNCGSIQWNPVDKCSDC